VRLYRIRGDAHCRHSRHTEFGRHRDAVHIVDYDYDYDYDYDNQYNDQNEPAATDDSTFVTDRGGARNFSAAGKRSHLS
jgi:hypothetical protein